MTRRALAFWLTCLLVVTAGAAWQSWVVGNLEPDFGDAFDNFGTVVGIVAVLSIPAALCHALAALLLRRVMANASKTHALVSSAISGAVYLVLLYVVGPLPLELPVKPLLVPCALGFLVSLLVLGIANTVSARVRPRAA